MPPLNDNYPWVRLEWSAHIHDKISPKLMTSTQLLQFPTISIIDNWNENNKKNSFSIICSSGHLHTEASDLHCIREWYIQIQKCFKLLPLFFSTNCSYSKESKSWKAVIHHRFYYDKKRSILKSQNPKGSYSQWTNICCYASCKPDNGLFWRYYQTFN